MAAKYRQISLNDTFSDCQDMFMEDTPSFFQLLDEHLDINDFIPSVFTNAFYQHLGRNRVYPLTGFLSSLILQKIFSIPTDSLLILFLSICKELRDFCGFSKVPDAPLFTRFRQNFEPYIELMFRQMVDYTEPICQMIDSSLARILTFDTSGIELFVNENNPKTLNALIKRLKSFYKTSRMWIPTRWPTGLCLRRLLPLPMPNRCISMGIFAMSSSSALSLTDWASSATYLFITKTLWLHILISLSKRNPIPLTKINVFMIQSF